MGTPVYNDTQCAEAAETVRNVWYMLPSLFSFVSSVTCIILVVQGYRKYQFRQEYHVNTKILVSLNMASNFIFSCATSGNYGLLLINTMLAVEDCDFLFTTPSCSIIRCLFFFTTMLNSLTHIALICERSYAVYKLYEYENKGESFGVFLATASIIGSMITVMMVTWNEDQNELLTNCYAFSSCPSISDRVYLMFKVQLALELITYFSCRFISRIVKQTGQKCYQLTARFTAVQTMAVLNDITPLYSTSSAIVAVYIGFTHFGYYLRPHMSLPHYKQLASWIFILPHHALITMILYCYFFRNQVKGKEDRLKDTLTSSSRLEKGYNYQMWMDWDARFVNSPQAQRKALG